MTNATRRRAAVRLAFGLALVPALPVALAPFADAATTVPSAHVTKVKDDGKTNTRHKALHVGDSFVITFTECGSCGYAWKVTHRPNTAIIKTSGVVKQPSSTGGTPVVGGSGTHTFTFKAKAVGTATAKVAYFAPGRAKPTRTVTISFTVTK